VQQFHILSISLNSTDFSEVLNYFGAIIPVLQKNVVANLQHILKDSDSRNKKL